MMSFHVVMLLVMSCDSSVLSIPQWRMRFSTRSRHARMHFLPETFNMHSICKKTRGKLPFFIGHCAYPPGNWQQHINGDCETEQKGPCHFNLTGATWLSRRCKLTDIHSSKARLSFASSETILMTDRLMRQLGRQGCLSAQNSYSERPRNYSDISLVSKDYWATTCCRSALSGSLTGWLITKWLLPPAVLLLSPTGVHLHRKIGFGSFLGPCMLMGGLAPPVSQRLNCV